MRDHDPVPGHPDVRVPVRGVGCGGDSDAALRHPGNRRRAVPADPDHRLLGRHPADLLGAGARQPAPHRLLCGAVRVRGLDLSALPDQRRAALHAVQSALGELLRVYPPLVYPLQRHQDRRRRAGRAAGLADVARAGSVGQHAAAHLRHPRRSDADHGHLALSGERLRAGALRRRAPEPQRTPGGAPRRARGRAGAAGAGGAGPSGVHLARAAGGGAAAEGAADACAQAAAAGGRGSLCRAGGTGV